MQKIQIFDKIIIILGGEKMNLSNFSLVMAETTTDTGSQLWMTLGIYALFFGALYFFFFRPQSKKKKKEAAMKKNAQVGDQITTIGGICGRIVAMREEEDSLVIETGSDKHKMLVKRWAIGSVDTIHDDE